MIHWQNSCIIWFHFCWNDYSSNPNFKMEIQSSFDSNIWLKIPQIRWDGLDLTSTCTVRSTFARNTSFLPQLISVINSFNLLDFALLYTNSPAVKCVLQEQDRFGTKQSHLESRGRSEHVNWRQLEIQLKFNNIPALVQIMAWRRPGEKPLSKPMILSLLRHMCVTWPQWVKNERPSW